MRNKSLKQNHQFCNNRIATEFYTKEEEEEEEQTGLFKSLDQATNGGEEKNILNRNLHMNQHYLSYVQTYYFLQHNAQHVLDTKDQSKKLQAHKRSFLDHYFLQYVYACAEARQKPLQPVLD